MRTIDTFTGPVPADELGTTLIHEHVFVGHPELDLNLPHPEWDEDEAVERAVQGLTELHALGVDTVVDLTVLGLGRDVSRVARVVERVPVRMLASTGYYTSNTLPHYFKTHGPGRLVGGADPLEELFVGDIEQGIAGTGIRAAMLKVVSDEEGITPDVERVFAAAAVAHQQTGVPITTHSHPASHGGLEQQRLLQRLGVPLDRVVIGHSGDSTDLDYLSALAQNGSFLGLDRFGMEHVLSDDERVRVTLELIERGLIDQLVLSHDASFFSRVTPPSWRAAHVPSWHMHNLSQRILPRLRAAGVSEEQVHTLMVDNPRRVLVGE